MNLRIQYSNLKIWSNKEFFLSTTFFSEVGLAGFYFLLRVVKIRNCWFLIMYQELPRWVKFINKTTKTTLKWSHCNHVYTKLFCGNFYSKL